MSSIQNRKAAVKKLKLLAFNSKSDINNFRAKIEEAFYVPFLPNKVECSEHTYGGIKCDVLAPELYSSKRVMLYIHGGSFVAGSRRAWRGFCATLANKAFSRVVVPEYRLAPSHAFPSAIEDIQNVFRALFTEEQVARSLDAGGSFDELPEIIIGADSSGASIALSLVLNLRERYRKSISKIVLFSPWIDVSDTCVYKANKKISDEILNKDVFDKSGEAYTYSSNLENHLVSPIKASKELYENFPSIYIQAGEKEHLVYDINKFKSYMDECNVDCTVDVWKDMMHLFQMADEYLEEAHDALEKFSCVIAKNMSKESERQCYENKPKLENSIKAEA